MCVQPMKAIATVAIAEKLTQGEIMAAGILTSAIVMFLGLTNLIVVVDAIIPKPVVRGLQIGLGLSMFSKAMAMMPNKAAVNWSELVWISWDGYLVGTICLLFCIVTAKSKKIPTAFTIFVVGVIIAGVRMAKTGQHFSLELAKMHVVLPTRKEWITGAVKGTVPQFPTTLLNSCIAVCKLSETLYPNRKTGMTLRNVSSSVGMMNIVLCWFGSYPMCHGAGGLAGQHRFGARTNLSIIVLGICKLLLGVFLGKGLLQLLNVFPTGMLAAMLMVASWELSVSGRDGLRGTMDECRICVLTAAFVTFYGQAEGIVIGIVFAYLSMFSDMFIGSDSEIAAARLRYEVAKASTAQFSRECLVWWKAKYNSPGFGIPQAVRESLFLASPSPSASLVLDAKEVASAASHKKEDGDIEVHGRDRDRDGDSNSRYLAVSTAGP